MKLARTLKNTKSNLSIIQEFLCKATTIDIFVFLKHKIHFQKYKPSS